jgi:UDP-glucose:(heptosyl)LPS alpha-1,3-glucosyltransferase
VYYAADTCYQAKARQQHGAWYRLMPRYQRLTALEKSVFSTNSHTHVLLISPLQQREFSHYYQTPAERFHMLPPGIAKDRIAPPNAQEIRDKLRQEFGVNNHELLLLMVGSGFKTKGLNRILLGISEFPDDLKKRSRLYVIGEDHAKPFQRQAQKLGIADRIKFLGGR